MYFNNELCEIDPGRGTIPGARNNRTNIPIRNLVEKIGGTVDWEAETETVTIRLWEHEVQMQLGSNIIMVDGEEKNMDVAPYEENGRTMVPIRFMAENLGFDVEMCSSAGFYNSIVVISCKELLDVQ